MLRFAASPTGDMDIETLRNALFNYIVAKQRDVNFLVRIEDLDKAKNITGKDTEILEILEKFALPYERASHQSENLHLHQTLAIRLLEEKKAFVCTCTPEQLKRDEENSGSTAYSGRCSTLGAGQLKRLKEEKTPFAIRLTPPKEPITIEALPQGVHDVAPRTIDAFVILDTQGHPTPLFASACDDMLMGIDFIIPETHTREEIPKQEHIKRELGYVTKTTYAPIPPIQSDTPITLQWLFEEGFIPDAIINYLLLLGNAQTPQTIFTLPDAIEWFDIHHYMQAPHTLDMEKLRTINQMHLALMDDTQLSRLFGFADADIGKLAKLYLADAQTTKTLQEKIHLIFSPKDFQEKWANEMRTLETLILNAEMYDNFEAFESYLKEESGFTEEQFDTPLRLLLTGALDGPALTEIYPLIKPYLLEIAS